MRRIQESFENEPQKEVEQKKIAIVVDDANSMQCEFFQDHLVQSFF